VRRKTPAWSKYVDHIRPLLCDAFWSNGLAAVRNDTIRVGYIVVPACKLASGPWHAVTQSIYHTDS
jgi:hypothetical protein